MILTPIEHNLELAVSATTRSPGLHISEVYNDLFSELEPNRFNKNNKPNSLKLAVGLAWETYLEQLLQSQGEFATRPGELVSPEGIYYSPDLFIAGKKDRLGEIKVTWMSSKTDLTDPKFDKWLVQAKIYCYWTEISSMRFYVLFLNGNYKGNREPEFKIWDLDFSSQELRENHQMLMNHAKATGSI